MISQDLPTSLEPQTSDPQVTDSTRLLCAYRSRQWAAWKGQMEPEEFLAWIKSLSEGERNQLANAIEEQEARAAALV